MNNSDLDVLLGGEFIVGEGESGFWYIGMETVIPGGALDYTVELEIESPSCEEVEDSYEANDSCGEAAAVSSFGSYQGYMCGPEDDEDWFRITTAGDRRLLLSLEHLHFNGNLDLEVYDATGVTIIDSSYNSGPNIEEVVVENTIAGDYCVRVFGRSDLTENRYTLISELE